MLFYLPQTLINPILSFTSRFRYLRISNQWSKLTPAASKKGNQAARTNTEAQASRTSDRMFCCHLSCILQHSAYFSVVQHPAGWVVCCKWWLWPQLPSESPVLFLLCSSRSQSLQEPPCILGLFYSSQSFLRNGLSFPCRKTCSAPPAHSTEGQQKKRDIRYSYE